MRKVTCARRSFCKDVRCIWYIGLDTVVYLPKDQISTTCVLNVGVQPSFYGGRTNTMEHEFTTPSIPLNKERIILLKEHEIPTRPWKKLGVDLFALDGSNYLILCDYYSKFPIVKYLRSGTTAKTVINVLREVFAEHDTPDEIVSDNGPQFDSDEFEQFAESWCITHVKTSPRYSQSNGFIERQVQTVKNTLKKATESKEGPQRALLILRSTPTDSRLPSRAEILNQRVYKSNMPMRISGGLSEVDSALADRQATQKRYYDKHAKQSQAQKEGESVRVINNEANLRKWEPATVLKKRSEPRSYDVELSDAFILRRSSRHIRKPARFANK
ncbi:uncharacterized protein K02A2.6-like [Anneissia japonica]|uniref:uncharacterized protein K02A2.6-like n=1 Tax=Anneissia japonica TaxID=1529436 RepID=UPI00142557CA|nr:uncharacterized protein K02A2.6-like [Anneissia japonica]